MFRCRTAVAVSFIAVLGSTSAALAQESGDLAKAAQNPVAAMISLPFQNNTLFGVRPDDDIANVLNIQPVIPVSCVLGAAIARTLLQAGLSAAAYGQLMAAWLVVVIVLFGVPLLAFFGPLRRLKEKTLLTASSVAILHERAAERALLGTNMSARADAEATAADEIPDTAKLYAAAKKLSTFLISRGAIVPVAAAALLPLVAAGATQLPVRELLKIARGLVLL